MDTTNELHADIYLKYMGASYCMHIYSWIWQDEVSLPTTYINFTLSQVHVSLNNHCHTRHERDRRTVSCSESTSQVVQMQSFPMLTLLKESSSRGLQNDIWEIHDYVSNKQKTMVISSQVNNWKGSLKIHSRKLFVPEIDQHIHDAIKEHAFAWHLQKNIRHLGWDDS